MATLEVSFLQGQLEERKTEPCTMRSGLPAHSRRPALPSLHIASRITHSN
jgi:hypothetical protein